MRIGGIASGIDTQQIINDLMKAERMPLDKLFQQKEWFEWKRDALRDVNLSLAKFRDSFDKLRLQSTFRSFEVNSSNSNAVTATGGTMPSTYDVQVAKLAKVASYNSSTAISKDGVQVKATTKVLGEGEGPVSIELETNMGTAQITVTDQDTFASLASKIANAKNSDGKSLGLRASFDETTGRYFISTREMGEDKWFTIKDLDSNIVGNYITGTGADISIPIKGQYGEVTFNGILINGLTKNTLTVNGINLTLLRENESSTLTVSSNPDQVFNTIKEFVESYNKLIDDLQGKLIEPRYRSFQPLTKEQREAMSEREAELWDKKAKSGLLNNDPILRSVLSEMRQFLSDPVQGIPSDQINSLFQIGITTTKDWRSGGRLEINETKLRAAIQEKPDEVMNLFSKQPEVTGNTSQTGLGSRINSLMNESIKKLREQAGSPGNTADTQSAMSKQLKSLNEQMQRWERRLVDIEDRYWRQFTAMEKAVNQMNSQSAFIMQNMFGGSGGQ